jgi:hypothetical protein
MADVIAKFKFDGKSNSDGYQTAKDKLKYEFGSYNGWTTDSSGWDYYIIIKPNIRDAGKAGDICRAYGGKPY